MTSTNLSQILNLSGGELARLFGARSLQYAVPGGAGPVFPGYGDRKLSSHICEESQWCLYEPAATNKIGDGRLVLAVADNQIISPEQLTADELRYASRGIKGWVEHAVETYRQRGGGR